MTGSTLIEGSCLCQQVKYRITGEPLLFQYCHCSRCRKFTGSAFASNMLIRPQQFEWLQGEQHVGRFNHPDARHFATCFCKQCGSSLPWLAQSGNTVVIPAGTLDTEIQARPSQNVFCASSAQWFVDPSQLPRHDQLPE